MKTIKLDPGRLTHLRQADPRVQSYNIEMSELVGGTFWAPYTPGQVDGTEPFPEIRPGEDMVQMIRSIQTKQPAVDLTGCRIRTLAKAFGPVIVRFSGSWATGTYYDFDGHTNGKAPKGFENVLTRAQWQRALDFARAVDAQILVSVANSAGVHENGTGEWTSRQAEILWDYTASQGMKIDYAEFMNEPNIVTGQGLPEGYGPEEFARDHDLFAQWLRENHPETTLVGPGAADSPRTDLADGSLLTMLPTEALMEGLSIMPSVFSYHSYAGISERGALFGNHYPFDAVLTKEYLTVTMQDLDHYRAIAERYVPDSDLWVTESADAGCGGDTWAPTFVECFRYLIELAEFNRRTRGILFHNTLCSSAYGFLDPETHLPRPQYWAALLFSRLMGPAVYDTGAEGYVYAQSRKDGRDGICWLMLNTDKNEPLKFHTPAGIRYLLDSEALRSGEIRLNGRTLTLQDEGLPDLSGEEIEGGVWELPPLGIAFLETGVS